MGDTFHARETERLRALVGTPLAGFPARAGAFAADFAFSFAAFGAAAILLLPRVQRLGWLPLNDMKLQFNFSNWYSLVFLVLYFGVATFLGAGQTPGKRLFRIRVVSTVHERLSFWHCLERALGYGASVLEFGFGFLQFFIDPNRRTVHDRIAETIVIRVPRSNSRA
jgi:uncharacterized RDD family membrane protein YckC